MTWGDAHGSSARERARAAARHASACASPPRTHPAHARAPHFAISHAGGEPRPRRWRARRDLGARSGARQGKARRRASLAAAGASVGASAPSARAVARMSRAGARARREKKHRRRGRASLFVAAQVVLPYEHMRTRLRTRTLQSMQSCAHHKDAGHVLTSRQHRSSVRARAHTRAPWHARAHTGWLGASTARAVCGDIRPRERHGVLPRQIDGAGQAEERQPAPRLEVVQEVVRHVQRLAALHRPQGAARAHVLRQRHTARRVQVDGQVGRGARRGGFAPLCVCARTCQCVSAMRLHVQYVCACARNTHTNASAHAHLAVRRRPRRVGVACARRRLHRHVAVSHKLALHGVRRHEALHVRARVGVRARVYACARACALVRCVHVCARACARVLRMGTRARTHPPALARAPPGAPPPQR